MSIEEVFTTTPTTRDTATSLVPLIAARTVRLGPYFICNPETRRAYANAQALFCAYFTLFVKQKFDIYEKRLYNKKQLLPEGKEEILINMFNNEIIVNNNYK